METVVDTIEKIVTVVDIIEEVKNEICRDYCRYADQDVDEICDKCPLSRLG